MFHEAFVAVLPKFGKTGTNFPSLTAHLSLRPQFARLVPS